MTVWPFFVIYSGFVLSILVVWQVTWSVPYDCSLVGLRHFSSFIHPSEVRRRELKGKKK